VLHSQARVVLASEEPITVGGPVKSSVVAQGVPARPKLDAVKA